eukprot:TRINITY_DN1023_c0_g1_i13.p1 TRINITY_DN1023_c0_g1~~TRINITY_DN1023_c0_g1_i13.p1  ORF type:complete len:108 (-),score=2.90 TRINITY_DN1023_c0_g1_i13:1077-1400(-)
MSQKKRREGGKENPSNNVTLIFAVVCFEPGSALSPYRDQGGRGNGCTVKVLSSDSCKQTLAAPFANRMYAIHVRRYFLKSFRHSLVFLRNPTNSGNSEVNLSHRMPS